MTPTPPSQAELRAQIARINDPLYLIAAEVPMHPTRLGLMLNEHIAMPDGVAQRLQQVLAQREARRSQ